MLSVCLPGTGGMIPLENRWLTCCYVEYQGKAVLIDCGEGTQIALKRAGCRLGRIDVLLITHFHADHIAGLPGLLLTIGNNGKATPLTIVGPKGLPYIVSALTVIAPSLPYPVKLLELPEKEEAEFSAWDGLRIASLPLDHWIPCYGYRLTVDRMPVFNPQKAQALGVPVQLYRALHGGESVELPDGRTVAPHEVLDKARAPIQMCYCTDTRPVPALASFAEGCDLLIAEGMYGDNDLADKAEEKYHMLFADSARLAAEAGVGQLWLTHYSPSLCDPERCLANAQALFPNTLAAYDGIRTLLKGEE